MVDRQKVLVRVPRPNGAYETYEVQRETSPAPTNQPAPARSDLTAEAHELSAA